MRRLALAALLLLGAVSAASPQEGFPVTNPNFIGGVDQTTAWSPYTPTVTCSANGPPTLTTNAGRYRLIGKTVIVQLSQNISALNGCTGTLNITVPPGQTVNATGSAYVGTAFGVGTTTAIPVTASNASAIQLTFLTGPGLVFYFSTVTYEAN